MRLGERERRILGCIQLEADLPVSEIARRCGYRIHVTRRVISALLRSGSVSRKAYLNTYALGLAQHNILFSLKPESRRESKKLVEYLRSSPMVTYFVALGGRFEYDLAIAARTLHEISAFFEQLAERFGDIFSEKSICVVVRLSDFQLLDRSKASKILSWGVTSERAVIDDLDHKILREFSNIGNRLNAEIARKLGIPLTTLDYRLRRLKEAGVIAGSRYLVDLSRIGRQQFVFHLYTGGPTVAMSKRLSRFCAGNQFAYFVGECIGSWDYSVGASVCEASEVVQFIQELQASLGNSLVKIETSPVLKLLKLSDYPFEAYLPA